MIIQIVGGPHILFQIKRASPCGNSCDSAMANTPEDDAFLKSDEVLPPTPDAHQQVQIHLKEVESGRSINR